MEKMPVGSVQFHFTSLLIFFYFFDFLKKIYSFFKLYGTILREKKIILRV